MIIMLFMSSLIFICPTFMDKQYPPGKRSAPTKVLQLIGETKSKIHIRETTGIYPRKNFLF